MSETWQDRLTLSAKKKYNSVRNLCIENNISDQYFVRYMRDNSLTPRVLNTLEKAGINPEYIKNGTLPMFIEGEKQNKSGIPLYEIGATGGDVHLFNDHNEKPVSYINMPGLDGKAAIIVHGDSMHPVYSDGDIITIDEPSNLIIYGKAHLIICENQRMIKYLLPSESEGKVICKSENPVGNPQFEIFEKDIIKLFLIKNCVKKFKS